MANEQNLKPCVYKFTDEDRKKALKARQENLKRKKTLREAFEVLLSAKYDVGQNTKRTGFEVITWEVMRQALEGNIKAFEVIRDTIGEKPVERVVVAEVDPEVVAEVERMVLGEDDGQTDSDPVASD